MKSVVKMVMALVLSVVAASVYTAPRPDDPKRQTPWDLYVDAKEAYEMKQRLGDKVLFVDVRDPIEIMFTGFTDVVDVNVPFKLSNLAKWHPKKPVYAMEVNPDFEVEIARALERKGLTKAAPIILMCRSGGTRGAPSAKLLWGKGYEQVYVVTDGFEGGKIKEGERKNWRLKNGWKNASLPWSYKLNREKMYFRKDCNCGN